jgi:hypothetical protein
MEEGEAKETEDSAEVEAKGLRNEDRSVSDTM